MEERIWHKHYAEKVPTSLDYEKISLPDVLKRTVSQYPDSVALNMMGKKITYRELGDLVERFATALADLGVKKGDRIALCMPNMPQMVVATYAVFRLGAVVVMNNPLYTERELEYQLNDSGCTVCVCMDLLVPRIQKLQKTTGIKTIIAAHIRDYLPFPAKQLFPFIKKDMHRKTDPNEGVHDFMDLVKKYPPKPPETSVGWDDMAALLYTRRHHRSQQGCDSKTFQLLLRDPDDESLDFRLGGRQGQHHRHFPVFPYRRFHRHDESFHLSRHATDPGAQAGTSNRAGHDQEIQARLVRVRAHHLCGPAESSRLPPRPTLPLSKAASPAPLHWPWIPSANGKKPWAPRLWKCTA